MPSLPWIVEAAWLLSIRLLRPPRRSPSTSSPGLSALAAVHRRGGRAAPPPAPGVVEGARRLAAELSRRVGAPILDRTGFGQRTGVSRPSVGAVVHSEVAAEAFESARAPHRGQHFPVQKLGVFQAGGSSDDEQKGASYRGRHNTNTVDALDLSRQYAWTAGLLAWSSRMLWSGDMMRGIR